MIDRILTWQPWLGALLACAMGAGVMIPGVFLLGVNGEPSQEFELDECPRHWERLPKRLGGRLAPEGFVLTGPITDVPEFHDCQKLLVRNGRAYGPLVAVFASQHLDTLFDTAAFPIDTIARSAGLILNLGTDAYQPLRIRPGFSCLYVWRRPHSLRWYASIRWVNAAQGRCADSVPIARLDTLNLDVHRTQARNRADSFPPVARWDWDQERNEQYIGIKCGSGWCEIGQRRSEPFAPADAYLPFNSNAPAVQRLKGWYDEQYLAVDGANSTMQPSRVLGTVFPAPGSVRWETLEKMAQESDPSRRWMNVAYIAINEASQHYKLMLNLERVAPGSELQEMNVLAFCWGLRARCSVPPAPTPEQAQSLKAAGQPRLAPMRTCDRGDRNVLWVRITPARRSAETAMYRCVHRTVHDLQHPIIPATARWRWLITDETVWRECTQGCCQVEVADDNG